MVTSLKVRFQSDKQDFPSHAAPARFYALLKIHNPTLAFCPIASNIGTASYNPAYFLSQFLSHFTSNNLLCQKVLWFYKQTKKYFFLKLYYASSWRQISLLMFPFEGHWIVWKQCYVGFITLLLELRKFWLSLIYVLDQS